MIRNRAAALTVTVLAALALAGCGTEPSPTTAEGASGSDVPDLLYAAGAEIHDGDTAVDVQGVDEITAVQRASDGWVVAAPADASAAEQASDVSVVAPDGSTTEVATIRNTFDVNADGTLLVASDTDGVLRLYSTADGSVVKQWQPNTDGQENVSEAEDAQFADGGAVVVRARDANGDPIAVRWEPKRGANIVLAESWDSLVTSDDGGTVAAVAGEDQCLVVGSSDYGKDWKKCQWTAPTEEGAGISPDGESVLAAPAGAEGELGKVAVLDVADGDVSTELTLPDGATSASWAGPEHLVVVSEQSSGSTVSVCALDGSCDTVAKSADPVVLGG